jgi:hypothetical protein
MTDWLDPGTGERIARILLATLGCFLALAPCAPAEGAWVLWARACDLGSQVCGGEWQRRQTNEAERWCRAAWTAGVNQALTPEGIQAAWRKGTVWEYQCLADTVDPCGPKGKGAHDQSLAHHVTPGSSGRSP